MAKPIYLIGGSKGGVGKTLVTMAVVDYLEAQQAAVLLIESDTSNPDVWKAYQTLLTNSQALRAADDLLSSAEQSEKVASGRYQAGLGNILDVLTAQSALANARQQRVTALYNFQASRFALAQAMGQLDLTLAGIKN